MNVHDEIELLLPTKGARWTLLLTSMLLPFAFAAPHFLIPLLPKSTEAEIVLMQILAPVLLALIGSLIILFLVVRAYHDQKNKPPSFNVIVSNHVPKYDTEPIEPEPTND